MITNGHLCSILNWKLPPTTQTQMTWMVVEGNNDNILQAEATTSPVIGGWIGEERWKWKGGPRKFNLNSEPRKNTVNL